MPCTIFLDRDGVINRESDAYIKDPSEFHFIPKSAEAIALLNSYGFEVIIITNQSMIGRQMASPGTLEKIFKKMTDGVAAAGGRIKDIFFCPHLPDEGCACRKPEPGMILAARDRYSLDLSQSLMVGDSAKDIRCARNAGCGRALLVATGRGQAAFEALSREGSPPDYFGRDLFDTAQWIIAHVPRPDPDSP